MLEMIRNWYSQRFSDPQAVTLILTVLGGGMLLYFFGPVVAPVLVALSIAYLLEWPVQRLCTLGLSRSHATSVVMLLFVGAILLAFFGAFPVIWEQGMNLAQEIPTMVDSARNFLMTLPQKYPRFITHEQLRLTIDAINSQILEWGQAILGASLHSLINLVALLVYAILVPLMVFFFLKDKDYLLASLGRFVPEQRRLVSRVMSEMDAQIMNYIRGKVIEILIVGLTSFIAFTWLDLRYSALLGLMVGLSVLIPYVGATVVTFPVLFVALFQFGLGSEFGYVMLAYGIIQALDGNLLVPLLFSEAVDLHPVYIILAVIVFGGLFGFWGVFFAIPLASLVRAIVNAINDNNNEKNYGQNS